MERRILDISMRQVFRLTRGISPRQLPTDHDYSRKKRSAGHAFPSLRQVFRTVLAVKGSLCRAKGAAEKFAAHGDRCVCRPSIVYPRARHRRCWVHKMRNILEHDVNAMVKQGTHAIYKADSRAQAVLAFHRFQAPCRSHYGSMVRRLQQDLPNCSPSSLPRRLWRKLRASSVIEHCFVEVRRRTRHIVCFVNVASVD